VAFRAWAGDPSLTEMAARSRQMISRSSMQRTLNSRAMPSLKAVMAIVIGCGGTEDDQRRFATARRRIAAAAPQLRAVQAG
jgi:hypothetical protein